VSERILVLYVIDAGIVVKWFIPEEDSAIAHQLLTRHLQGLDTAIAPDLLISECGNVFWRRCRQGDLTPEEATESLADLLTLNLPLVPASSLVQSALRLALQHQRTVYDSLYLSLSEERGCPLLTADERFFNAVNAQFSNLQLLRHWQPPTA
jgi:predicted nucleic acid-binding protein